MRVSITKLWLPAALGLITAVIPPAMADQWNKETQIHISTPVQIPGTTLNPGTYVFKLLDSPSNRNIVVVYSVDADGNQTFVTSTLVVPAYRLETPYKPMVNLEERHTGTPEAIHTWFYPGDNYGWEFVYPKSERLEVAVNEPTPAPVPAPVAVPEPPALEDAIALESLVEETPVVMAQNEPPTADPVQEPPASADRELPETAGNSLWQLAAAIGMLGLGLTGVLVGCRQSA